jgi:geranylgeranyl diphosphate synthase type I
MSLPFIADDGAPPRPACDRTAKEVLGWARTRLDPALREVVERLPPGMRRIAGYHFGWLDAAGRPAAAVAAGKAMRPALVLLCAEAVGGHADRAIPAAVAVELAHNFSLLHDDVMDGDELRRHRPTVWAVFGTADAILAGDVLLSLAFDELARSQGDDAAHGTAARRLNAAVTELVRGQSEDCGFQNRNDVGLAECLEMARGKTAALIACACALGGLYGGDDEQVDRLWRFGMHAGLAFQLVDDLLGIWGDPRVTGKPAGADLRVRKKSLPVVAALTSDTPAGRRLARVYHGDRPLDDAAIEHAKELIEEAGGRSWARDRAGHELATAAEWLAAASPRRAPAAELRGLTDLIAGRSS